MNNAATATRVYGGLRDSDFEPALMKPGTTIVRSIRPPKLSSAGLHMGAAADAVPGTACVVFEVIARATVQPLAGLCVECAPGEAVLLRNAHLEPLQPDLMIHAIKSDHILVKLPTRPLPDDLVETHIALVREEDRAPPPEAPPENVIRLPSFGWLKTGDAPEKASA